MRCVFLLVLTILIPVCGLSQQERWVYRYSGVYGWRVDCAYSIVYGSDGYLYAAGRSWHNATRDDFTVISLTSAGTERWIYTYNGLADYGDGAQSIVYGEDGNIYVAGSSYGSDTTIDLTVISLTSTGIERWVYQYNGQCSGHDYASSIAYGYDSNIYIVGLSWNNGTWDDFIVIGLTNDGVERWVYLYNGPGNYNDCGRAIVYGSDGNIYTAGDSYGIGAYEDFTVISLTDSGVERWVYRYNGSGNWADYANSLVYGPDNNIYAIGTTYGNTFDPTVICLDSSGADHWIYRPPEIGSDGGSAGIYGADGNIYVAGAFGDDVTEFMVVSLTDSGTGRWEYIYYTPIISGLEGANSIVYGNGSTIYAAGCIADSIYGTDLAIVCLYDTGTQKWKYLYNNGVGLSWNCAFDICYGADGFIYACGMSTDSITGEDFTVISLDPDVGIQEDFVNTEIITYRFLQTKPNPFRDKMKISYSIEHSAKQIGLKIYNATGRLIKQFGHQSIRSCSQIVWDGMDDNGQKVCAGVYFVRLETTDYSETKKVILLN